VLAHYICSINGALGCDITYQSVPDDAPWNEIPTEIALEVYRIVQEGIGNALKHAKASLIAVGMKKEGDSITLTIANNEKNHKHTSSADGIGSRTIQQRTKAINGTLTTQHISFGTVLQLTFSLN
jgi:signal transduction histidine kinase